MDQAKEYLRLAIKYRFWIIVGVSALLPIIGYAVVAGDMETKTTTLTGTIKGADSGVKPFQNGIPAVPRWTELAKGKTEVVTDDVNKSWRKLYERQAPLLDWPKDVEEDFKKWGSGWPKDVDPNKITLVIDAYVQVYPKYVEKVYSSFDPWNPEEGTGIVVAPPKEVLLHPAVFTVNNPPTLGKVHVAQKRLWIQRTLLDLVHNVNEQAKAKDWDGAWIKQITGLEVASALAQDQKSAAQGQALVIPEEPVNPNAPPAPAAATPEMGSMRGMPGMGGMGGAGGSATDPEVNQFIDAGASKDKYDIVPVALSFFIEQSHIPDVLIAFENSPMAIQVVDVDWQRPDARVRKPVKGETQGLFDSFGSGMGGRGNSLLGRMGGMMGGMGIRGGAEDMNRMRQGMAGGGAAGMAGIAEGMGSSGSGMMGVGPTGKAAPKGKDRREEAKKAAREKRDKEKEKEKEKAKGKGDKDTEKKAEPTRAETIADPYYNIVEVHLYGQARFYKRPPDEAQPAASPGAAPTAEPAKDQPAPAADAKKDETKDEAKKDETKEEAKKDEAKGDEPKKDEAKTAEPKAEVKPELSKEAPKGEEPKKDEPKKDEPAKAEPAKEEPKPKTETPKR
jgi:hypothetical protein